MTSNGGRDELLRFVKWKRDDLYVECECRRFFQSFLQIRFINILYTLKISHPRVGWKGHGTQHFSHSHVLICQLSASRFIFLFSFPPPPPFFFLTDFGSCVPRCTLHLDGNLRSICPIRHSFRSISPPLDLCSNLALARSMGFDFISL